MKIEQLIVQHLYNNKSVTLQGIGTIHLDPSVTLPTGNEKDFVMPENAFWFDYNLKAAEDTGLIDFIVQQTRKIKPLASSDLESYSILAKQFLNIGKPLVITGIGTIQKNQEGLYEFIPGTFISPKIDDIPRQVTEKTEEPISFEHESTGRRSNKRWLVALLAILVLAGAALTAYYFTQQHKNATESAANVAEQPQQELATDTAANIPTVIDSTKLPADTNHVVAAEIIKKDSNNFRIVLKQYPTEAAANKAFKKLTDYGHKVELIKIDSFTYQLAMPFTTALADTTRAKDSLRKFFGGNPFIKIAQ
ncbi:MAG: hypothetical protein RL172_657 [Bacteroidota bacterium]